MVDRTDDAWAPIALFLYKRADHARQTITSLQACPGFAESPHYVYADGPRHEQDVDDVRATRAVARELLGERAVFIEREHNLGLSASIIAGVTELCDRYGKVIVVEDDLAVAPSFLQFLNDGLHRYADDARVMQLNAFTFDAPALARQREAVFLPLTASWGWATWKRAWDLFDRDANGWQDLMGDKRLRRQFDLDNRADKSKMLALQMQAEQGGWDVVWYYTLFKRRGLALFPPRSLVFNIGLDGSGAHSRLALPARQAPLAVGEPFTFPSRIEESPAKEQVFDAIAAFQPRGTRGKALALLKLLLRRWGGISRRAESEFTPVTVGTAAGGQQPRTTTAVATSGGEGAGGRGG
ncbi:MAG: hypothetical protein ACRDJW_00800 [Thermomicrobiales bacterium]